MKLIKLDRRHRLHRHGYTWAFRFDYYTNEAAQVEHIVDDIEGRRWTNPRTHFGRAGRDRLNLPRSRPFYVAMSHESTATMVLLKV